MKASNQNELMMCLQSVAEFIEFSIALTLQQVNRPKQTGMTARDATSYMERLKEIEVKI